MAIVHVTSENYEKEVLQSDKPVLIISGHHGVDRARC